MFVDPDYTILGFNVVQSGYRDIATDKLKLRKQPPTQQIIALLEKGSPNTEDDARKWFEVLASRIGGMRLFVVDK